MVAKLPGFRREAGSGRGYITPEGDRISYREYRNRLEGLGLVERLEPLELANQRQKQAAFNDVVRQMAKVRRESLERQAEAAEEIGDDEAAEEYRELAKRTKSEAIRSPARKEALQDLKTFGHDRVTRRGQRRLRTPEAEERVRRALETLGRREGIPEWVPVGASDKFKRGELKRPRSRPHNRSRRK